MAYPKARTDLVRADLWRKMLILSKCPGTFLITDLHCAAATSPERSLVKRFLKQCESSGRIVRIESDDHLMKYRVLPGMTVAPEPTPARAHAADRRQNMWNALRATRGFLTTIELAVAASTDTVQVSRSAATRYLNALDCAGYLTTAYRLRQTACYRLAPLYNTGPKAPALVGRKGLFDFNRAVNVTASQNRRVA